MSVQTFLAFLEVEDDAGNPLAGFPEFRAHMENVERSRAAAPEIVPLTVVGSYRLF